MAERNRSQKGFLFYLGRWAWVLLISEIAFLLVIPVFVYNRFWHPQVIACAAAILVGAAAAFFSRLLLPRNQIVLRFFFPWISLLLSLLAMDALTRGQAGFGFFAGSFSYAGLLGLIPAFLGTGTIILVMLAFPKKRRLKKPKKVPARSIRTTRQRPARQPVRRPRPQAAARRQAPSRLPAAIAATIAPPRERTRRRTERPLRLKTRKKENNGLRLIGSEEHRCPYCLEIVEPNDRRGVMICDVCHAYHHKDCWDITGRCQVPHQAGAA